MEEVKDWEPIENNPDNGGYRFLLFDNGSSKTIYKVSAEDRDDSYVAYFRGLMYKINKIINVRTDTAQEAITLIGIYGHWGPWN